MTPKQEAALLLAREALKLNCSSQTESPATKAITAIREALAEQPAQEPVAWINTTGDFLFQHPEEHGRENEEWFPLVHQNTSPQPSKPLTDAQIGAVAADIWGSILIAPQSYQAFARAIEAAHGITGETK